MTPLQILNEAARQGLRLSRCGDRLTVKPFYRCPAGFLSAVREHKPTLLRILSLPPDERAWLHVCRQVLEGEFNGADGSTAESVTIGLRALVDAGIDEAVLATERLKPRWQKGGRR